MRLRLFQRFPLSGVASHSCRRRTFQSARFDIGADPLADLQAECKPQPSVGSHLGWTRQPESSKLGAKFAFRNDPQR